MAKPRFSVQEAWGILELRPGANPEERKRAYRSLAFKYHPDRNKGNEEWAAGKFREIREAYDEIEKAEKQRGREHVPAEEVGFTKATGTGVYGLGIDDDFFELLFRFEPAFRYSQMAMDPRRSIEDRIRNGRIAIQMFLKKKNLSAIRGIMEKETEASGIGYPKEVRIDAGRIVIEDFVEGSMLKEIIAIRDSKYLPSELKKFAGEKIHEAARKRISLMLAMGDYLELRSMGLGEGECKDLDKAVRLEALRAEIKNHVREGREYEIEKMAKASNVLMPARIEAGKILVDGVVKQDEDFAILKITRSEDFPREVRQYAEEGLLVVERGNIEKLAAKGELEEILGKVRDRRLPKAVRKEALHSVPKLAERKVQEAIRLGKEKKLLRIASLPEVPEETRVKAGFAGIDLFTERMFAERRHYEVAELSKRKELPERVRVYNGLKLVEHCVRINSPFLNRLEREHYLPKEVKEAVKKTRKLRTRVKIRMAKKFPGLGLAERYRKRTHGKK